MDRDLRSPIISIYLNKINQRQIFETQAFKQIMDNVTNPEILIQILDNYICQSIAFSAPQNPGFPQQRIQEGSNVISDLNIEARMNVYNQFPTSEQNPNESFCPNRNYVKENCKNVTHVKIAYFINQQITKEENKDPLEYFENYRQNNNE